MIDDEKGGADDSDDPGDILVVEARDAEGEAEHGEVVILLCRSRDREAREGAATTSRGMKARTPRPLHRRAAIDAKRGVAARAQLAACIVV